MTDDEFFADLPAMARAAETFAPENYRPAPDDWLLCVTDVENSTGAIDRGLHKRVNFAAASAIAALKNLCAPASIPVLFGGDGCVAMVPAARAAETRLALARVRGFVARDLALNLRVGAVAVRDIRAAGAQVLVGRFEPAPGNAFGVFLGGGVQLCEDALKGRGDAALAAKLAIAPDLDDGVPPDMSGLSCRWNELASTHGQMMSVIVAGAADPGALYREITRLAELAGPSRPVRGETLKASWPPPGLMLEAHARRGRWPAWLMALRVGFDTLIAHWVISGRRNVGGFNTDRYLAETAANTDFCKFDDSLCFVIDCSPEAVAAIRGFLEQRAKAEGFRFGLHLSPTALMTCLVQSAAEGLHVHFVDGGDGGYTSAARKLRRG